jgi:hypothetical protein
MYREAEDYRKGRVMSGSFTAFEMEAERRRELVESALREAADRRALQEAARGPHRTDDASPVQSLAEAAAGLFNRVSQRT